MGNDRQKEQNQTSNKVWHQSLRGIKYFLFNFDKKISEKW
jgi:hypothetical protein